uniref:Pyridoxal phosphate homeostasis protein n=1 Tax=Echinococcus canadensis TaxID=519352 RepID=A0A915EYQ1_9CEST
MSVSTAKNLELVLQKIEAAFAKVENTGQPCPQLVAVSKTKPPGLVIEAYNAGQKAFGENYIQELVEKSNNEEVGLLEVKCPEIQWHFIGRLQSNKIKLLTCKYEFYLALLAVPNLAMVQTVSSLKIANLLNSAWQKVSSRPLDVLIQVNTSGEERNLLGSVNFVIEKGGVAVSDLVDLYKAVFECCPHLNLRGLMTIGRYGYDENLGPNPDFLCLYDCRNMVCDALGISKHSLHLSMGMSSDYEMAVIILHLLQLDTLLSRLQWVALWFVLVLTYLGLANKTMHYTRFPSSINV